MAHLPFVTLDVFTTKRFTGNPLAVVRVPQDVQLSTQQMQTIASEFNLSETVILHEGKQGADGVPEWRVRIFLTDAEIPFAGHPTIGTACFALGTLAKNTSQGRLVCNAGPIELDWNGSVAKASIPHDFHIHTEVPYKVEDVYRVQPSLSGLKPATLKVISPVRGMTFVCVELPDLQALASLKTSGEAPNPVLDAGWEGFPGSYFFVLTAGTPMGEEPVRIRARMIKSTLEDSATGSAACALSCHLALKLRRKTTSFAITQGVEMGRQSEMGIVVTLKAGLQEIEKVELSGSSVKVMEGMLEV